ncbi:hypothetical protein MC7420_2899 [Coleofasciculus chthonoplastes PCC 7420]|uniref:Uncharacterized protein n=1 Tax=Coleofasciculus chthonoplastes PCC 7420 TaxID=118168 RepID=B4VJW6_9CYAN|nr:hypothetical protein MC7420_2899 [Coleofasciculus chthonoplastes PCC 7420]
MRSHKSSVGAGLDTVGAGLDTQVSLSPITVQQNPPLLITCHR